MTILIISQIIFNIVISLAVVVVAILISVIAYDIIKFMKSVKKLSDDINRESGEVYNKINKFLEGILTLSFVSKLFKKKKK